MVWVFYDDLVMSWLLLNDNVCIVRLIWLFVMIVCYQYLVGGGVEVVCGVVGIGGVVLWDFLD